MVTQNDLSKILLREGTGRGLPFAPASEPREEPPPEEPPLSATIEELLRTTVTEIRGLRQEIRQVLSEVQTVRSSVAQNTPSWNIVVVFTTSANDPVQGPDLKVPPGFAVVVLQRRHSGAPTGYVSYSETAVQNNLTRSELTDAGSRSLKVANTNEIWLMVDSIPSGETQVEWELILETLT